MCERSLECFLVKVQDPQGRLTKDFLLYPGIPEVEIQQVLRAAFSLQVAGLYSAMLDIYFPIALFSRAPKYFSRRAPYRVVPVLGDGGDWRVGEAKATQHETHLEEILRQMFLTDTALQQEDSGLPQIQLVDRDTPSNAATSLNPGLAEFRTKMGISLFPAKEVLDALCSAAASDGRLTRAEFDDFLQELARLLEIPALSTANQVFDIFDGAKEGVLHVKDLSAGLAMLCDGSLATSVRSACRLYEVADGRMGFADICGFTLSIFKVLYAAAYPGDWAWPGMSPQELSAVVSSEFLVRKGVPLSGRVDFTEWFSRAFPISCHGKDSGQRARLLEGLGKHDMQDVFELLSVFVSENGDLSSPAFLGCMRALFEVDGRSVLSDADTGNLKNALRQVFDILDERQLGTVPLKDLASGISTFCGSHDNGKTRAVFDIHGKTKDKNGDSSITMEDTQKFLAAVFKVLFEVGTDWRHHVKPERLAETTAAHAFENAALKPDGSMGFDEFHRWYSSSIEMLSPLVLVREGPGSQTSSDEPAPAALDVEEVHRIFKLRDMDAAGFIRGLNGVALNGRVSWISFLRYMCALTNARPLTEESRAAVVMAKKLFAIFDEEKQREVDLRALASGLAVLCNGSWKDRVAALFSLLDTEGQGALSRGDMQIYFSSTFKLLGSVQPSINTSANSNALAEKAVVEAFRTGREGGVPEPERFDERMFAGLYSKVDKRGDGQTEGTPESPLSETLEQARQDAQLCNASVAHTFGVLKDELNGQGRLTRPAVHRCVRQLRAMTHNGAQHDETENLGDGKEVAGDPNYNPAAAEDVMDRLFDAVDVRDAGDVDFCEFASALSVLCGGTREEKMLSIFNLFRRGEGGGISVRDVATYTTSVFRAMYKLQPSLEGEVGITPEALGTVTASKMMEEMSPNGEGRISPRDFGWWLSDEGSANGFTRAAAEGFACDSPGHDATVAEDILSDANQGDRSVRAGLWGDQLEGQSHVAIRARKLLRLDCFNVNDLLEILAEVAVMSPAQQGTLDLDGFWRCVRYVLQLGGTGDGTAEWDEAFLLTERIHRAFQDKDGVVAFAAITCGISILCQSTVEEKILVAFVLFDMDEDGKLSFEEVNMYIASVLRVIRALSHDVTAIADPDELGAALASQCFSQAKIPEDGKLGIEDFLLFAGTSGFDNKN